MIRLKRPSYRLVLAFTMLGACTEQKLNSDSATYLPSDATDLVGNSNDAAQSFNKNVGKPIDPQLAHRWINNLDGSHDKYKKEHFIQSATIKPILDKPTCVGISLYYAIDNLGQLQIIPIGVNENGRSMPFKKTMVENRMIDSQTAWKWIGNYSGQVRAHFFGSDTFNRHMNAQKVRTFRATRAQSDSGQFVVLLSNADDPNPTEYDDLSRPCPPFCTSL